MACWETWTAGGLVVLVEDSGTNLIVSMMGASRRKVSHALRDVNGVQ